MNKNQTELKIRELRSDDWNIFQIIIQIKHLISVAYVSKRNGKAERLNRNLLQKAHSMLVIAKLYLYVSSCDTDFKLFKKYNDQF